VNRVDFAREVKAVAKYAGSGVHTLGNREGYFPADSPELAAAVAEAWAAGAVWVRVGGREVDRD
jgi:hypothetical protein